MASGAAAFDRRTFARADYRQAVGRAVVIGFGTLSAAGLMGGAVTVAAIWIIAGALGAAPHLNTRTPIAPATVGLAEAYGKLATAAKASGWMRGLTHTVQVAETTLDARLMSAEILTASLIRAPQPMNLSVAQANDAPPAAPAAPAVDAPPRPAKPAMSRLASLEPAPAAPRSGSMLLRDPDSHTAIYDIAAHVVYLPNGQKLEAHSGLGGRLDDPRYVHEKARGPTPPNVYDLTLREELFHGVRALRLNPVNDSKMYGRDGILAHTYMLGPSGQSFGCVSFKDYPQFLKAYLRGEINRLVVVPHLETRTSSNERTRS
jgi:hypothetical protein